jgi:hypothetical protein
VLASALSRLGADVALTADVSVASAHAVMQLLALHADGRLRLEALSLACCAAVQELPADDAARLVAVLSSAHLSAQLTHVSLGRTGRARRYNDATDAQAMAGEELLAGALGALATAAPRLHTLELFDVSSAALHAAAAVLAGRTAFSLARLDVLVAPTDMGAVRALAAALPASLRALSVDVRESLSRSEPQLAAFAAAAAARCPHLRSLRLAAYRGNLGRHSLQAARRRLLKHVCAAAPRLRASFLVYGTPARMSVGRTMCRRAARKCSGPITYQPRRFYDLFM